MRLGANHFPNMTNQFCLPLLLDVLYCATSRRLVKEELPLLLCQQAKLVKWLFAAAEWFTVTGRDAAVGQF
jgi:hypothetical protein